MPSTTLLEKRQALFDKMQALHKDMGDNPTADQKNQWAAMHKDINEVGESIQRENTIEAEARAVEADAYNNRSTKEEKAVERAQGFVRHTLPNKTSIKVPAIAESEEYAEAYSDVLLRGRNATADNLNLVEEVRATSGGASGGAQLIPTLLLDTIVDKLSNAVVMRRPGMATVLQLDSRNVDIPIVDHPDDYQTYGAAIVNESGTSNDQDVVFTKVSLSAVKIDRHVRVSEELLEDSILDLPSFLGRKLAERIGYFEDTAFIGGSGGITGLTNDIARTLTTDSATALAIDDVIALIYNTTTVNSRSVSVTNYWPNASFIMHPLTAKVLRQKKDSQSRYLWEVNVQAGQPDFLLGFPVHMSVTMGQVPSVTGTTVNLMTFGDHSQYYIGDRGAPVVQRMDEVIRLSAGQIAFRVYKRTDGILANTDAVHMLNSE